MTRHYGGRKTGISPFPPYQRATRAFWPLNLAGTASCSTHAGQHGDMDARATGLRSSCLCGAARGVRALVELDRTVWRVVLLEPGALPSRTSLPCDAARALPPLTYACATYIFPCQRSRWRPSRLVSRFAAAVPHSVVAPPTACYGLLRGRA